MRWIWLIVVLILLWYFEVLTLSMSVGTESGPSTPSAPSEQSAPSGPSSPSARESMHGHNHLHNWSHNHPHCTHRYDCHCAKCSAPRYKGMRLHPADCQCGLCAQHHRTTHEYERDYSCGVGGEGAEDSVHADYLYFDHIMPHYSH
jgi:hypothetical protein